MIRRLLCSVILVSLTMHCISRVGLLSYLYENRHSIAYSFGIISEIPIAICSSHYDFNKVLVIDSPETDQQLPAFASGNEINLFLMPALQLPGPPSGTLTPKSSAAYVDAPYSSPVRSIFHPPA
jgi:hypothetical protein